MTTTASVGFMEYIQSITILSVLISYKSTSTIEGTEDIIISYFYR